MSQYQALGSIMTNNNNTLYDSLDGYASDSVPLLAGRAGRTGSATDDSTYNRLGQSPPASDSFTPRLSRRRCTSASSTTAATRASVKTTPSATYQRLRRQQQQQQQVLLDRSRDQDGAAYCHLGPAGSSTNTSSSSSLPPACGNTAPQNTLSSPLRERRAALGHEHNHHPWYHGAISRDQASARLRCAGLEDGLFLIRQKTPELAYAISVCTQMAGGKFRVVHHLVERSQRKDGSVGAHWVLNDEVHLRDCLTIEDVVSYLHHQQPASSSGSKRALPTLGRPCQLPLSKDGLDLIYN